MCHIYIHAHGQPKLYLHQVQTDWIAGRENALFFSCWDERHNQESGNSIYGLQAAREESKTIWGTGSLLFHTANHRSTSNKAMGNFRSKQLAQGMVLSRKLWISRPWFILPQKWFLVRDGLHLIKTWNNAIGKQLAWLI